MVLLHPDGTEVDVNLIVGNGTNGLILLQRPYVLKIPLLRDTSQLEGHELAFTQRLNEINCEILEAEKDAYRRLEGVNGIAECIDCSPKGILLKYYNQGTLEHQVIERTEPEQDLKFSWIETMIKTVRECHRNSVLINDVALRNFLIINNESLKMIDFGQSEVFGLEHGMIQASNNWTAAEVDIFQLGCAIYSILVWKKFEMEVPDMGCEEACLNSLPLTDGLVYGSVIQKCWRGLYQSMDQVFADFLHIRG